MRLIFVRHAQTSWNTDGRYQGRMDVPLCAVGRATAKRLARRLRTTPVTLLLASPLRRATVTAATIGEALGGLSGVIDERLTEIDFGQWQGLTQAQIKVRWPQLLRRWKSAPESVRFPRGESLRDALDRLEHFLRQPPWPQDGSAQCVLAVSHAGLMRLAGLVAEGRPLAHFRQFTVQPGDAQAFEWRAGGRLRRIDFPSTQRNRS